MFLNHLQQTCQTTIPSAGYLSLHFEHITHSCRSLTHLAGFEVKLSLLHVSLLLGSQRCHLVLLLSLQKHLLGGLVGWGFTGQIRCQFPQWKASFIAIMRREKTTDSPQLYQSSASLRSKLKCVQTITTHDQMHHSVLKYRKKYNLNLKCVGGHFI